MPRSYVDGEFLPDERGWNKEVDRVKSQIGRYPIGFRHYESYTHYAKQFPERTIEEYINDVNSQITFDEYLLLCQKAFLYETGHNPYVVYELGLNLLDYSGEDPEDQARLPEAVARSPEFKERALTMYESYVHDAMARKTWFSKVAAFEQFTDTWSYGRNLSDMPTHNIFVPNENPIMPLPKFRNYEREDHEGKDFTYRSRDQHNVSALTKPSTLKPAPLQPPTTTKQN